MKTCNFCAEKIQDEAIKCRHCGEFLNGTAKEVPALSAAAEAQAQALPLAPTDDPLDLRSKPSDQPPTSKAPATAKSKQFTQDIRYISTAILFQLLFGLLGVIANSLAHQPFKSPVNIIDFAIFYYLSKKSETARIIFIIRLILGALLSLPGSSTAFAGFMVLCLYGAMLLLVTGESKKWRMITALGISVPLLLLSAVGLFVK